MIIDIVSIAHNSHFGYRNYPFEFVKQQQPIPVNFGKPLMVILPFWPKIKFLRNKKWQNCPIGQILNSQALKMSTSTLPSQLQNTDCQWVYALFQTHKKTHRQLVRKMSKQVFRRLFRYHFGLTIGCFRGKKSISGHILHFSGLFQGGDRHLSPHALTLI